VRVASAATWPVGGRPGRAPSDRAVEAFLEPATRIVEGAGLGFTWRVGLAEA
jgi:hypothetical protein